MSSVGINQMHFSNGKYFQIIEPQRIIVAKSLLQPGIKTTLENFLLTSDKSKDRERAYELLASIEDHNNRLDHNKGLVKEYKMKMAFQRPKTACSKFQGGLSVNQYTTAYSEDFPRKEIEETMATRPQSTQNIIARPLKTTEKEIEIKDNVDVSYKIQPEKPPKTFSDYDQHSTYTKDYCSSEMRNNQIFSNRPPIRAATASGSRCHNPHPSKAFLVWRFPRESLGKETRISCATALKTNMDNNFAHIDDEQFNRVMRGKCKSTYQADFVGGAPSEEQVAPYYLHPEIKTGQKLKLSTQRVDYDRPSSLPVELSVPKDRYTSNKVKKQPAKGIIPFVTNKTYMNTFSRTTYDEDINDRAQIIHGQIIDDVQKKVDLGRLHNMKDLERALLEAGNISDKETLQKVFIKLNEPENFKRISFVRKPFYKTGHMSWMSNYPGPL